MKTNQNVKLLQAQGLGSKKFCEKIFYSGSLFINGRPLDPDIDSIQEDDVIEFEQNRIVVNRFKYIMLHKPVGFETSQKPQHHESVYSLLPWYYRNRGVQAAGRLDQDTTGLLILSDDGQFIHQLISGKKGAKHQINKVYELTGAEAFSDEQLQQLLDGVMLNDELQAVCASKVRRVGDTPAQLELSINTGKYHQVKRMIAAVGNRVIQLHRSSVGPFMLPDDLQPGEFMEFKPKADWHSNPA